MNSNHPASRMPRSADRRPLVVALTVLAVAVAALPSQSSIPNGWKTHKASAVWDNRRAPAASQQFTTRGRKLIRIDPSRLPAIGVTLRAIAFRRIRGIPERFGAGEVDLAVTLSTSVVPASKTSWSFDANVRNSRQETTVYNGRLILPASPKTSSNPDRWNASDSYRINFTKGFVYRGGTLSVDMVATPVPGKDATPGWRVASEQVGPLGRAAPYGKSCSSFGGGRSLLVRGRGLHLNGVLELSALVRQQSHAMLFIGGTAYPSGISLDLIGATGCNLYLDPMASIVLTNRIPGKPFEFDFADFATQIPLHKSLMGQSVFLQHADFETRVSVPKRTNPAGLVLSDGVRVVIASKRPATGMAVVTSRRVGAAVPIPTRGSVEHLRPIILRVYYTQ